MPPIDCLFLDRKRVVEFLRLNGGIPKDLKVAVELSTNPKIQFSPGEQPGNSELIEAAIERMCTCEWIGKARPATPGPANEWIHEVIEAQKFTVPARDDLRHQSPGFNFWISYAEWEGRRVASLCLLEHYHGLEGKPIDMWPFSTYSCLMSLVHYARREVDESVLSIHIPNHVHEHASEIEKKKTPSMTQYFNVDHLAWEFVVDTEALLTRIGCLPSSRRLVSVLYRVREYGYEGGRTDNSFAVFGYPIWVLDAGGGPPTRDSQCLGGAGNGRAMS